MVDYVPITESRRLDERLTSRVIMRIYMTRGSIRVIDERVSTLVEVLEYFWPYLNRSSEPSRPSAR